jgi:hypothetical protein
MPAGRDWLHGQDASRDAEDIEAARGQQDAAFRKLRAGLSAFVLMCTKGTWRSKAPHPAYECKHAFAVQVTLI